MGNKKDQDYPFIKETIKERPVDRRGLYKKIGTAAVCGVVFGICAVLTMVIFMPGIFEKCEQKIKKKETIQLTPSTAPTEAAQAAAAAKEEKEEKEEKKHLEAEEKLLTEDAKVTVDHLERIYEMVLEVAEEPKKALVHVSGITGDSDLLNDTPLTYGDEGGIVFLKNEEAFYIMTTSERLEEMERFRITFSNGKKSEGELCGFDPRTNIIVIKVRTKDMDEKTRNEIPAAKLSSRSDQRQTQPIIALGSPVGDADSLIYGTITSTSGKLTIADAEYSLLTTDMAGSQAGGGILIDMNGEMIGVIMPNKDNENSVVRAVSVAQIRHLLEILSNGKPVCYVGIRGTTISDEKAKEYGIPQGIYVDRVEQGSPAMNSGIQSGDILYKINDEIITTMKEYSTFLQSKRPGDRMQLTLHRKSPSGEYVDVELSILIKEK